MGIESHANRVIRRLVRRGRKMLRGSLPRDFDTPLDVIGLDTGTDKASNIHNYLGTYDATFQHLRNKRLTLIEFGVHRGASVAMWRRYFRHARIVGIDIQPSCKEFANERVAILVGDQSDEEFLTHLAHRYKPTIVVDDGSHKWAHQKATLRSIFPVVKQGGFYVVEDIHTSFGEDYHATYGDDGPTAFDYVSAIARGVVAGNRAEPTQDDFEAYCRSTIELVTFLPRSVIIKKAGFKQEKFRTASVRDVAESVVLTDVGPPYARVPAELVGNSAGVAGAFGQLLAKHTVSFPPAASAEARDVRVVGQGLVLTSGGLILSESLNCAQNLRRTSGMYRPMGPTLWVNEVPIHAEERYPAPANGRYVLLKQTWDNNYGHWLIDTLPKVGLLQDIDDLTNCTFILNPKTDPQMRQVVLDSMDMLGIGEHQLLFLGRGSYEFERLTVLGTLTRHPYEKSPFAVQFLERFGSDTPAAAGERLFISRNAYSRRRLVNEDAVLEIATREGYRVVRPETMSLREQVAVFKGASHVIGNLGAGMSNLVFSPKGVSVLALATEAMGHNFFYDIVCHKDGRYRGLQGVATDTPTMSSDFTVDLDLFSDSLEWLHS